MSYPKDLDEYTEDELNAELQRRAGLRSRGLCDYCGRAGDTPTCKEHPRHLVAALPCLTTPEILALQAQANKDIGAMMRATQGWGWPINSRKAHYFVESRSLCGKWAYLGKDLEQGNNDSLDNCTTCKRKLCA